MDDFDILEEVYVSANSIIFDKDGKLLDLHPYIKLGHPHVRQGSQEFSNYINITELPLDEYIDLTHYYSYWPFAHRYDALSRMRHIESLLTGNQSFLIGSKISNFARGRFDEECGLFGINNKIYFTKDRQLFKVKRLIYPHWIYNSDIGNESPVQFTQESFNYCRNKYSFQDSGNNYKLFLTRTKPLQRSIINSGEVHEFFNSQGFVILNGTEDLKTTMEYFYNAKVIIGVHGGLFSNIIFCGKVSKIVEIFPKEYWNGCFLGWNSKLKTDYQTLIFDSSSNNITLNQENLIQIMEVACG